MRQPALAIFPNFSLFIIFSLLLPMQLLLAQTPDSLTSLVAPGATLLKVSDQFAFTEGPAVDKAGNIYFTDQPNDKIWKYDLQGQLSLFMEKTGRSNGMAFDRQGRLISCADEKNQLLIIDGRKTKVLLSGFHGKAFNGPNDLWIDKRGGIYFTDPYYQRDYWTRKQPELSKQNVYYLPPGARAAIVVDSNLQQPNGITGTPDGKTIFVADIRDNKTYRYTVTKSGALTNRTLFAGMGSDGMTIDEQGNLYLTGKGVTVYNAAGKKLGTIPVPAGWVGNCCFGGKDRKTLFITASTAVYTLAMQVKGVE